MGIAEQFTAIKGLLLRLLPKCMALDINSLPAQKGSYERRATKTGASIVDVTTHKFLSISYGNVFFHTTNHTFGIRKFL